MSKNVKKQGKQCISAKKSAKGPRSIVSRSVYINGERVYQREEWLSTYVERINDARESAAVATYCGGAFHTAVLLLGPVIAGVRESARELGRGNVAPHLDICWDDETFLTVLAGSPVVRYDRLELPSEGDAGFNGSPKKAFDRLSDDELAAELQATHGCTEARYRRVHVADARSRQDYYEAVLARFEAAIERARKIKSGSVRLWLEAIRLLTPRGQSARMPYTPVAAGELELSAEQVAAAYEVAERAQGELWVDNEIARGTFGRKAGKAGKNR